MQEKEGKRWLCYRVQAHGSPKLSEALWDVKEEEAVANSLMKRAWLVGFFQLLGVLIVGASQNTCFVWQAELTESGPTTWVMRSRVGPSIAQFLGLNLDVRGNFAAFTGLELIISTNPAVEIELELEAIVATLHSSEAAQVVMAKTLKTREKYVEHLYIPFTSFKVVVGKKNLNFGELKLLRPLNLHFTPYSEAQVEIRRVAFYVQDGEEIKRTVVDGFSYETFYSLWKQVVWYTAYHDPETGWSFEYLDPSPLHQVPWNWFHTQGGTLEVIPDPTGSGRGLVCRVTIPPLIGEDGVRMAMTGPRIERWRDIYVYRVYGSVEFNFQPAPCEVSLDVWLNKELLETSLEVRSGVILLDVFDQPAEVEPHSLCQAKLWYYSIDEKGNGPFLDLKIGDSAWAIAPRTPQAPTFTPEEWHTITIRLTTERMAQLYVDGVLAAEGPLPRGRRCGTTGGHTGLYIHDPRKFFIGFNALIRRPPYAVHGTFLFDNYVIRCCGRNNAVEDDP